MISYEQEQQSFCRVLEKLCTVTNGYYRSILRRLLCSGTELSQGYLECVVTCWLVRAYRVDQDLTQHKRAGILSAQEAGQPRPGVSVPGAPARGSSSVSRGLSLASPGRAHGPRGSSSVRRGLSLVSGCRVQTPASASGGNRPGRGWAP